MLRRCLASSTLLKSISIIPVRFASTNSTAFDAIVVGSGIIGCCTALDLARKGFKVAVVDKQVGAGEGTTSFSSGIIRTYYSTVEVSAVALESYHIWNSWRDFLRLPADRYPELVKVRHCASILPVVEGGDDYYTERVVPCSREVGIPHEFLNAEQMASRLAKIGWTNMDVFSPCMPDDEKFGEAIPNAKYKGGWYYPETAYVSDPRQATKDVFAATTMVGGGIKHPAQYFFNSEVTSVTKSLSSFSVTGVEISNTKSKRNTSLLAPVVVNCTGPWSGEFTKLIFSDAKQPCDNVITTRALRTDVAVVDAPAGVDVDKDGLVVMDLEAGFYMKPDTNNRFMVGGVESKADPFEWLTNPEEVMDSEPGPIFDASVYRTALRVPTLDIPTGKNKRYVVSSYDVTEDWNPIVDRSCLGGLYQVIGTSGNCFKTAPVLGKIVSDLIDRESKGVIPLTGPQSHDAKPISVHLDKINRDISTALFHRKRKAREGSFVLS